MKKRKKYEIKRPSEKGINGSQGPLQVTKEN